MTFANFHSTAEGRRLRASTVHFSPYARETARCRLATLCRRDGWRKLCTSDRALVTCPFYMFRLQHPDVPAL